jgi:hypothetical protein
MCRTGIRGYVTLLATLGFLFALPTDGVQADQERPQDAEPTFDVNVDIALSSLMSFGDGHLQKMADSLHFLAASDAARSAEWDRLREPYAELAKRNVPALNWFALPDGSYWSVQGGKETGNLARRDYFPKVLAGETVMGELLLSTATGKPMAIVAVPVVGADQAVVGVLGASVYLEELSEIIRQQMGVHEGLIFYSFDDDGLLGLVDHPRLIFVEPRKSGDERVARAFDEMLSNEQGVIAYSFEGRDRMVAYRRSPLTGWWYAFGVVR